MYITQQVVLSTLLLPILYIYLYEFYSCSIRKKLCANISVILLVVLGVLSRDWIYILTIVELFGSWGTSISKLFIICSYNYNSSLSLGCLGLCYITNYLMIPYDMYFEFKNLETRLALILYYSITPDHITMISSIIIFISDPMAYILLSNQQITLYLFWCFLARTHLRIVELVLTLYEKWTSRPFISNSFLRSIWFIHRIPATEQGSFVEYHISSLYPTDIKSIIRYITGMIRSYSTNNTPHHENHISDDELELDYLTYYKDNNLKNQITLFEQKCHDLVIGDMNKFRVDTTREEPFFTINDLHNYFQLRWSHDMKFNEANNSYTYSQIYKLLEDDNDTKEFEPFEIFLRQLFKRQTTFSTAEALPCIICMDSPRVIVNIPCRHLVSCTSCSVISSNKHCAICKGSISQTLQIYT